MVSFSFACALWALDDLFVGLRSASLPAFTTAVAPLCFLLALIRKPGIVVYVMALATAGESRFTCCIERAASPLVSLSELEKYQFAVLAKI